MSLTLHVDGDRWRAHLRRIADSRPGLTPVAKGNGYGFGNHRLARRAQWLGVDTLAVGTYDELPSVLDRFDGDIMVLTPWRPFLPAAVEALADPALADRLIHTIGRLEDLQAMLNARGRPRVVLERATAMRRHGFDAAGLREAGTRTRKGGVRVEGAAIHLPLIGATSVETASVERLLNDITAAGIRGNVWVSHLAPDQLAALATSWPALTLRPRIGTELWLGAPEAMRVTATVLDRHPVRRGDRFGYRGRSAPRAGTILIVSGGTAHGIGLESPLGEATLRSRTATAVRGTLDAAGVVRSPYSIAGRPRMFAEPPHMQSSMLFLPAGVIVPEVGSEVDVRVRHTATTFDRVEIS